MDRYGYREKKFQDPVKRIIDEIKNREIKFTDLLECNSLISKIGQVSDVFIPTNNK